MSNKSINKTKGLMSRRNFLTKGAAAGMGAAAIAATGTPAVAANADEITWDVETDVVVIGAGASGLPASIAAADGGAEVMLIEQHFDIGGIAIMSGGNIHIGGGNPMQVAEGIEDSPDLIFADWTRPDHDRAKYNDRSLVRKFADENVATFHFLVDNGVNFERHGTVVPDGARGSNLGGPGSASTVPRQVRPYEWPIRSDLVALDQGRNGSGIVRPLELSARDKGVKILLSHKMTSVVREGERSGRVIGVTVEQVDRYFQSTHQTLNIRARKGVILCTGGHGNNVEFRRIFDPRLTEEYQWHGQNLAPHNAAGEIAAMNVGASLWAAVNQTAQAGSTFNKGRTGTRDNYVRGRITPESPVFFRARASGQNVGDWQNLILVKENGLRFWDETDGSYEGYFSHAMAWSGDPNRLDGGGPIWAIFDSAAVEREEWSTDNPVVDRAGGYFFSGETLEELASGIIRNYYQWRPMPGDVLTETVRRFNSFVDSGTDNDFNRPSPPHKIETPPFYAAWATPNLHDSLTGLRTNTDCQVMDTQGEVIEGLYSAGENQGGFAQHGLGRCIVFGRIAGMHAAQEA